MPFTFKVKVLYDFQGETNRWWEGANSTGASGLFPEAYVERITAVDDIGPSVAPPPLPPDYDVHDPNSGGGGGGWKKPDDDWGNQVWGMPSSTEETSKGNDDYQAGSAIADASPNDKLTSRTNQGYDQDEWDSDFDDPSEMPPPTTNPSQGGRNSAQNLGGVTKNGNVGGSNSDLSLNNKKGPVYLLLTLEIINSAGTIRITIQLFIAYRITPSFSGIPVSRRYKHFDWLHERLTEKFAIIPIPPLPDKQIQGRYEDEFIDHRMIQLQSFCQPGKLGKEQLRGIPLLVAISFYLFVTPEFPIDSDFLDRQVEYFTKFSSYFDSAVKNMHKVAIDQSQKSQNLYKREFQTIGKAFIQLGQAMEQDPTTNSTGLNNAITCTGETYEEIANLLGNANGGAMGKRKEFEKLQSEGKVSNNEVNEIVSRTDEQITYYKQVTGKLEAALQEYDNC
ncbi:SNX9_18_33 [Lepeophtheirus salmonis]|uniref:SNX9_18_33 n=1 Tax=Lepeophtheirus salmonis TaxID=72036 RepID=A0A7R8H512_LEPSM|nr:SNX9_18_33 [Lepeophtheirus salmonis]CAF2854473.1 SNX9_18_33 [Lepeophtheirus salmonis]